MTFKDILHKFRTESFTEKEKGTKFERLMRNWLLSDPRYNEFKYVWMWEDFPGRKDFAGGTDIGIDLVAKTELGEYWAIQCKCYKEDTSIQMDAVANFITASSKSFIDAETFQTVRFSHRLWISTTLHWGKNAEDAIKNQNPPVNRIGLMDLEASPVDWQKLLDGIEGKNALLGGKQLFKHQLEAISKAYTYYRTDGYDRGKLIMACGTGKTFTSLRMVEQLCNGRGLILFMVPSISLLGQSLNHWMADAKNPIKAICICSDNKAQRKIDNDNTEGSCVDLALPATTDAKAIAMRLRSYMHHDGLVVVFSTYQSIDAVSAAQQKCLEETNGKYGVFDFIVCDEAHRTTGVILPDSEDEGNFTKVHKDEYVQGKCRLYMTATPRLYGSSAKIKASQKDLILCSMDDEALYGKEIHRVNFSYAVQNGLLTDYKVFVLTIDENDINPEIESRITNVNATEYNYDDTGKLIGVINGLSKIMRGDEGKTWEADPRMMRRAVAFCNATGKTGKSKDQPGTSIVVTKTLPEISRVIDKDLDEEQKSHTVSVDCRHIDGGMNSSERNDILNWLREESDDPRECRVVTNVRCLSEGVDVPALDAVLFLSARNSQVDVVQSVGRVMRNFRKGESDEKKYGYIIIPIVTPSGVKAEDALNNNSTFDVVWQILNALRSHDDSFNAEINKINLNDGKSTKVIVGGAGIGTASSVSAGGDTPKSVTNKQIALQLELRFQSYQEGIYAKLVEKCGDRLYWENWAKEVGTIATTFIERISRLVGEGGKYEHQFAEFLSGLKKNINPYVDLGQAVEMLAQHMICKPVFDALFADYEFVKNNAVSTSMERMLGILHDEAFEKDMKVLDSFYESVRMNVGDIDNLKGKQSIIYTLYEQFFKGAFPKTVERLGIVYTPVECVDFILHSVNDILKQEFGTSLTEENVHILDPFTGTGTFITRLLESGLIKPEDMERKYLNEIHCNELVLLAYYVADINIESVFHSLTKRKDYLPYDGICLTDTFQLNEGEDRDIFSMLFPENSERALKQKKAPVRVIIGNPPYSAGQKSANDNAQNLSYKHLDGRIADTYVANTKATNKNSVYDSYIKAFRWSSDRISAMEEGGVVAFISNGGWLDGNAQDGMRKCLEREFTDIYVLNLRGNCRTSGEMRRKEGDGVFGFGSRTPITITFLVKNPKKFNATGNKATIHYHDIGDYLTREKKLEMVKDFKSVMSYKIDWKTIVPNEKNDWINQRGGNFDSLIPFESSGLEKNAVFEFHSMGIGTARDSWVYNYGKSSLVHNVYTTINYYNQLIEDHNSDDVVSNDLELDETRISWSSSLSPKFEKRIRMEYKGNNIFETLYRPFVKQNLYFGDPLIHRKSLNDRVFAENSMNSLLICVMGFGCTKDFSIMLTSIMPDYELVGKSKCYPLYYYDKVQATQLTLFDDVTSSDKYIRRDGITDWILKEVRKRYSSKTITKEMIFYYVYGLLHSKDYRKTFEADLKKSLPRIPIVEKLEDFIAFYKAGKALADLHLNYEDVEGHKDVKLEKGAELDADHIYDFFKVEKMCFGKKMGTGKNGKEKKVDDKSVIIYNGNIRLTNIPLVAYEYVVNGKSAIEWIMERYAITTDTKSGITNNPNDWSQEHDQPSYILDLLLSIINVSVQTVEIVKGLPKLKFD